MVDMPPAPISANSDTDWRSIVGEPQLGPVGVSPSTADPSPSAVDTPPEGNSPDGLVRNEIIADMQANRKLREKYADKAYQLATGAISMWVVLLAAQGIVKAVTNVEMWSDNVIIAVTTGVTVSVLAAFLGVIRGLFGNGASNGKDKDGN